LLALLTLSMASSASAQERPFAAGLGVHLYFDDGERETQSTNTGGSFLDEERQDIGGDTWLAGETWMMVHVIEKLRVGGGLRYFGSYSYCFDDDENCEDSDGNEGEGFTLGKLLEVFARAELIFPLTPKFDLLVGAEVGLPVLFPGGEFGDEVDGLDAMGWSTSDGPRLGYVLGPFVGTRFGLEPWLALRGDIGVMWEKVFLLDSTAQSGATRSDLDSSVDWFRVRITLGPEVRW
jgi:hypothetical protein